MKLCRRCDQFCAVWGKVAQRKKHRISFGEMNEQATVEIAQLRGRKEDHGHKIQREVQNEAELDWEISQVQSGERRRGSNVSQSTIGCCDNSAILERFVSMGAAQLVAAAFIHPT